MKLFLASEGSDPRTTKKLEEYVGGFDGKKVMYIPTARNGNETFNTWNKSGTWRFLSKSRMKVTPLQLEDYKDDLNIKLFENQDIIWFAGGASGYLMYWIRRTGLDKMLPEILNKTLYVGSSAGSMITAPGLDISEWYIGETERGASSIPGLGLVDFDFYPHYEDQLYDKIKDKFKGKKIYLVKNGEVVLVENGKVKVLGEERIISNT
jgi:dipeptidase E